MEWIDSKTSFLIVHLFGVAIGAGGAFMSDAMFMTSAKGGRLSSTEVRFLRLGSIMVWGGLAILVASGVGLVSTDPAQYLASTKFLAKATIVGIIAVNGLAFHFLHFPIIHQHIGIPFSDAPTFLRRRPWLLASGALSMVSWSSTIVLGTLRGLPWSYAQIMFGYALIAAVAIGIAVALKDILIPAVSAK